MIHGSKSYNGKLTFGRCPDYISQIDWALSSSDILQYIESFRILDNQDVPTDHAPISLELVNLHHKADYLNERATQLGQHSHHTKTILKLMHIQLLPSPIMLWDINTSTDTLAGMITELLLFTAWNSIPNHQTTTEMKRCNTHERWTRILECNDERQLWQSINWQGMFEAPPDMLNCPSDELFCQH